MIDGMGEEQKINWELIIHRLDTIAANQDDFGDRLTNIEKQLNTINAHDYEIKTLKDWKTSMEIAASSSEIKEIVNWKHNIDNIVSPPQLQTRVNEIDRLKTFRTQALMVWIIVQALMAFALVAQKYM